MFKTVRYLNEKIKNINLVILVGMIFFASCKNKSSIEGLWIVESVTVGKDQMTPNARWMKFNSDFTQQSGNGWFQHSIGTWNINHSTNELSIINSNGLSDDNDPFKIEINQNSMEWSRIEEGESVKIKLERANKLPTTYGDQLLGLWKLTKTEGHGDYFSQSEASNDYLFFGWDRRFIIGSDSGKINGVYNVHGHKPELELIPYGNQFKRNFWKIDFNGNQISLRLMNTDSIVTSTFDRIHEFPK